MIAYPNAKINLGLNVIEKRSDGFHNIETVFYPVQWCDALEIIENKKTQTQKIEFSFSGIPVQGNSSDNLAARAYHLLDKEFDLPPIKIHLHKAVPMGAGLGGGSSDAAFTIKLLNELFKLNLTEEQMQTHASQLGSDCAFFIRNKPVFAKDKGDHFRETEVDLSAYNIVIIWPGIHSNTAEAYSGIRPSPPGQSVLSLLEKDIHEWKDKLTNDFEKTIFRKYPEIEKVKNTLYDAGAVYSSMSGSGSAVFGIFEKEIPAFNWPVHYRTFIQVRKK